MLMAKMQRGTRVRLSLITSTLRQWIHDGSGLVRKRRKAPHTFLDAWKAQKLSTMERSLMEPLIPCIPFNFKAIFLESSFVPSTQDKSTHPSHESDIERAEVLVEPE